MHVFTSRFRGNALYVLAWARQYRGTTVSEGGSQVLSQAAPRNSGVAAGLLNTSVQCGAALGLGALAAIASAVTRSQQAGHAHAAALANVYVAGLLTGAAIYAVGAIVAALTINARLGPGELAGH